MSSVAQDQVARLLALLPYLVRHPGARVADVAAAFGVTERQLVADLNVLWFSGLPGHAMGDYIEVDMEAVEGEGVVRVSNADYLARPLRLAPDEATALLTALRLLAALPGTPQQDADAVARVTAKLEQAAGAAAERASAVRVAVQGDPIEETAATVRRALADRRRLHLAYWSPGRDETTERDVDPMRLLVVDGRLYLEGWCRRVESVRLFRLDRVVDVVLLDLPAQIPPQATPRDLSAGLFQPAPDDLLVTMDLGPRARWVAETYPVESVEPLTDAGAGAPAARGARGAGGAGTARGARGAVGAGTAQGAGGAVGAGTADAGDRGDGVLRVRLRVSDPAWVVRLALRLGPTARVVDPPAVVAAVRTAAEAALAVASSIATD